MTCVNLLEDKTQFSQRQISENLSDVAVQGIFDNNAHLFILNINTTMETKRITLKGKCATDHSLIFFSI